MIALWGSDSNMFFLSSIPSLSLTFGHHDIWWEIFSIGSAIVALALLAIALLAYKRHQLKRLYLLSIAFGLFVLKVGLLHLDALFPALESNLSVASVIAEFGMLSMLFLAMTKR